MKRHVALSILALITTTTPAWAVDEYEIQVYDGSRNDPGQLGLEAHMNHVARRSHESHLTFEPSVGVLPWWELGGYFQTKVTTTGDFDYAGIKLRSKLAWGDKVRYGVNFEIAPPAPGGSTWGGEARPILAWESPYAIFAFNPIVGIDEGKVAFEPALLGLAKVKELVGFGLEYYGSTDGSHYLYEVVHLLSEADVELSGGVGEGFGAPASPLVFKVIVGVAFDGKFGKKSWVTPTRPMGRRFTGR